MRVFLKGVKADETALYCHCHIAYRASRHCQQLVAEHIANKEHAHITRHIERAGDMTREKFCRWHNGRIQTSGYNH